MGLEDDSYDYKRIWMQMGLSYVKALFVVLFGKPQKQQPGQPLKHWRFEKITIQVNYKTNWIIINEGSR
jgi:hypothetical protein